MPDSSEASLYSVTNSSTKNQKIVVPMDNVLNRVILIFSILAGIGLIATPLLYQRKTASLIIILASLMTMLIAKILIKRGQVRLAGMYVIFSIWIIFTFLIFLGGGLENINVIFFVSLTVVAGLLFGERATLWVAGAGIAIGFALALMAIFNCMPAQYFLKSPVSTWAQLVLALVLTASTLNIALRERNKALEEANRQFTDRLEAEKALQESEIRNRSFLEAIPDLMFIFGRDGICLDYRGTDKTLPSIKPENFLGKSIRDFLPASVAGQLIGSFEKAHAMKQTQVIEHVMDVEGEQRYFEVRITAMDERRQLTIVRDITQRKRAEDTLKESEANYRQLFENAPVAIYRIDFKTGKILKANDVFCEYNGCRREDLSSFSIYDRLTEASKKLFLDRVDKIWRGEKVPETIEYEIIDKTGMLRYVHLHNKNIHDAEGYIVASDVVAHDVTERRRAENALRESETKFRSLVEHALNCILIVDLEGTIVFANNASAQAIAVDNADSLVGRNVMEFVAPESAEDMARDFLELAGGRDGYLAQYHLRSAAGQPVYVESIGKLVSYDGKTAVLASLLDVTKRRQAEEEQKNLRDQLTQAQKMESVGRLAGGVAHDFNNMLSVIIGNTEMAMRKVGYSDPIHHTLQQIMNAGKRSADLTRQLLAFARKQTVNPRVLDLNDTVAGMLKMLQRLIGEDIDLVWHPGHTLWNVKIDPSQVDQLLANLAVNARDAIEKTGRIVIETSNKFCDETFCAGRLECMPGEYVLLTVTDNGHGMDQGTLSSIFEPFFTTKKEGQGTGLGLATVYGIVKQNGGFIEVRSELQQGTTFNIYLPGHLDDHNEAADNRHLEEIQGGMETILIAEDEESVLDLTREILESLGYKVLMARNADLAILLVEKYTGNIDLLLTDVVMPDMNGKELAERIRAIKPGIRCLHMSGYTADVIARQGILDEGIQFIPKPFSLAELASKVRDILDG